MVIPQLDGQDDNDTGNMTLETTQLFFLLMSAH